MPQSLTLTAHIVKLLLRPELSGVPAGSTLSRHGVQDLYPIGWPVAPDQFVVDVAKPSIWQAGCLHRHGGKRHQPRFFVAADRRLFCLSVDADSGGLVHSTCANILAAWATVMTVTRVAL